MTSYSIYLDLQYFSQELAFVDKGIHLGIQKGAFIFESVFFNDLKRRYKRGKTLLNNSWKSLFIAQRGPPPSFSIPFTPADGERLRFSGESDCN